MLDITVTTVERIVFSSKEVTQVTLPTSSGEITILPHHVPLLSILGTGAVEIRVKDGSSKNLFVDGGVLQVENNVVELLANLAERAEELDEAKIEEAKRRAEQLLAEKPVDVDLAKVETALQRELMKQKFVRKLKNYQR